MAHRFLGDRVRILDASGSDRFCDRFVVFVPCSLMERLRNANAEHFTFAFVDARGEENSWTLSPKRMAVQERSAAVRFHEQLMDAFLLRFAAEIFRV